MTTVVHRHELNPTDAQRIEEGRERPARERQQEQNRADRVARLAPRDDPADNRHQRGQAWATSAGLASAGRWSAAMLHRESPARTR